jgi:hypothetical protein
VSIVGTSGIGAGAGAGPLPESVTVTWQYAASPFPSWTRINTAPAPTAVTLAAATLIRTTVAMEAESDDQ